MKFIVFEGLDGAGKSTLIEALKAELQVQNKVVHAFRKNKAHFRPFCQVTTPVFQLISALIDCGFKRILA